MGIRLDSANNKPETPVKTESENLEKGLDVSTSNPTPSPEEVVQNVAPPQRQPAALSTADLDEAANFALETPESTGGLTTADLDDAADYAINEPVNNLESSKVRARTVDANQTKQLKDIQEQFKIKPDEAMALLTQYPYEELKAQGKYKNITHDYPAVSKWAQNPQNMKVMQKDPDAFKKIEESTKMLGYLGDVGKVALQNVYMIPMMGLHAAVSTGTVSVQDAAALMNQYQDAIEANQITENRQGVVEIGAGMDKLTKGLKAILPYKFSDSKGDVTLDSLAAVGNRIKDAVARKDFSALTRLYKRYKGNETGLLDFLGAVAKNPSAALLMSAQSAYSIVPGLVAPVAGATLGAAVGASIGGVGAPVGAAVGTVGASYTTGFAVAYSQFFQEESEKFRNPRTNKIDFVKMYSDPAVVSKMRNIALKYASAHGLFEAIGGKLLGKTFAGAKAASAGSKIAALGVETLEQAVTEGAGETTAKLFTGKSVGESVSEGVAEAAFSVPFTPGAAMVQAVNLARINAKAKPKAGEVAPQVFKSNLEITKLYNEKIEASKAVQNKQIISEMRETKNTSPTVKEFPQQVQELIKESSNPTVEVGREGTTLIEDGSGTENLVKFDVNQFEMLAQQVGEDPMRMAEHLGPAGVEAYIAAKKGETGQFQVQADEYHRYSDNRPELDDIAYFNDAEMNAVEGQQTLDLAQELEETLLSQKDDISFDENEDDEPPPIPTDGWSTIEPIETEPSTYTIYEPTNADGSLGDVISRPIELVQSTRTAEQNKAYASILRKIKGSLKNSELPVEFANSMADLEFSHQRFRAETTGKSIAEIEADRRVGYHTDEKKTSFGTMKLPGGYDSSKTQVVFSPKADGLTVVHEYAHAWLHDMIMDFPAINDNLSRNKAQEDYYQAMIQTAKMFDVQNLGEIYKMDKREIEKIHETFAQTAEEYFLKGEHQNNAMRRVFTKVREWLVQTANLARRLTRAYPTLELTPDIERMFATILDATRDSQDRVTEMFPDPLFTAEQVGEEKAARYTKAIQDSISEAVTKLYERSFNQSLRERESLINSALDDIYDEARNQVDNLPSMVLYDLIKARGADGKLTYQSVFDHLAGGDETIMAQIKEMLAPGVMAPTKRRGVDVRDVMNALNIGNKEDFIEMLGQMKVRDTLVEQRAEQLMNTMFPALKTDDEMHAEAVKAIQESGRERILSMDLEILADKHMAVLKQMNEDAVKSPLNMKRKPMKQLKEIAASRVQQASLREFKPRDYQAAATKFNKQAASYVRQGDYLAAFDAKQQEAINSFAYLNALEIGKKLDKTTSNIKKLNRLPQKDIGKTFDYDVYSAAKSYVQELSEGNILSSPDEVAGVEKLSDAHKAIVEQLVTAMNSDIGNKQPGNIAVETMLNMGDLVQLLRKAARDLKDIEIQGKKFDIQTTVGNVVSELSKNKNVLSFEGKARYQWRSGLSNIDNLFAGMMTEGEYANSSVLHEIIAPVRAAENNLVQAKNADNQILSDAIKKITKNNPEAQSVMRTLRDSAYSLVGAETGKPVAAPEISDSFNFNNKGEIYKLLAVMMSEDGRAKVAAGGIAPKGKTPTGPLEITQVDKMFNRMFRDGTLKRPDVDFVQGMLDLFDGHYDAVKESVRKVYGFEMGRIEARSLSTPWGDYKGGYIPLKKGDNITELLSRAFDNIEEGREFIPTFYPVTNTSMTKARSDAAYPINLDLSTLRSELSAVYRIAYMLPTMHEVGKVIGNKDFINAMEARRPGAMKSIVTPWFKKTMAQVYIERVGADKTFQKPLEKGVQILTNRARNGIFLFNYMTWAKQYIGVVPAMKNLPAAKIGIAASEAMVSPIGQRNKIKELSPLMRERFDTNSANIIRSLEEMSLNNTPVDKFGRVVSKATYFPIQLAQNHVDTIVWNAAYDTALNSLKLEPNKAINYADNYVLRTQTSNDVSAVPAMRSGTVFDRMWTTFASVPIGMAGLQLEAKGRNKPVMSAMPSMGEKISGATRLAPHMANAYLFTALLPGIMAAVVGMPAAGLNFVSGDDEDKEEYMKAVAMRAVPEALDSVFPVFAQNIAALYGGYTGDSRFAQVGVLPLSNQLLSAARGSSALVGMGVNALTDGEYGQEELSNKDLRDLAVGFSLMTDIPIASIPFTLKRAENTVPELDFDEIFSDLDLSR